jgi:hypothetical protein
MAKTKPGYRVALQLDTRIALEASILNRLQLIPQARRQEWLRGLLVQGFRQECQTLQGASGGRESQPAMAFVPRLDGAMKSSVVSPEAAPVAQLPAAVTNSKPFAALGKVIG